MSSGMSKQEEELLDQKIARIRKKNEEILRRKREIEEDKKFAEQNNAMVQLRPSTEDWPRERTPALRPSQREMQLDKGGVDADEMIHEPLDRNKERNQPASRGRETSGKGAAPPPDPVSFLADPDRDYYSFGKEPQSFTRGTSRNIRGDVRRGGPRRGRGSRGSGYHNHQGHLPSSNDDAWREERYRIDEARINRQKSADGKWRREWDNEKINLESQDEPVSPSYTSPSGVGNRLDRWKQQPRNYESGDSHESPNSRGRGYGPGGGGRGGRGSRGRGNYKVYPEHSPPGRSGQHGLNQNVNTSKYYSGTPPMPSKENYSFSTGTVSQQPASPNSNVVPSANAQRFVTNVGDSFKIVVPNVSSEPVSRSKDTGRHMSRKGRPHQQSPHEIGGYRQRLSQSQSSYSEDEYQKPDKEVFHKSKPNKQLISLSEKQKSSNNEVLVPEENKAIDFSKSQKPPLPPFRTSLPKSKIGVDIAKEAEDGELSWEDVTTSGTESIGDDYSSFTSSPRKLDSFTTESDSNFNYDTGNPSKDPKDIYTPEDFILLVPSEVKYSENVSNSSNLHLAPESVLNTEAVSLESENIVKDPVDIYTPDDFIKLVPSNATTTKNIADDNCSTQISSSNNEETLELDASLDNELDSQSKDPVDIYKPEDFIRLVPSNEVIEDKSQDIKSVDSANENLVAEDSQKILPSTNIPEIVTVSLKEDSAASNESFTKHSESEEVKVNSNGKENSDQAESDKSKDKTATDNNVLKTETRTDVISSSEDHPPEETG